MPPAHPAPPTPATRLLRIQEVAAELGLTTRSIRYYEEIGLLEPAARSGGDYRLYDADDLERLRYIKGLRDDAGFSLAEIAQLLEDEVARARNRDRFRSSEDATERRAIVTDALARVDRQVTTVRAKVDRLEAMIAEAEVRRTHLREHLAAIDAEIAGDAAAAAEHERAAHATGADHHRAAHVTGADHHHDAHEAARPGPATRRGLAARPDAAARPNTATPAPARTRRPRPATGRDR